MQTVIKVQKKEQIVTKLMIQKLGIHTTRIEMEISVHIIGVYSHSKYKNTTHIEIV